MPPLVVITVLGVALGVTLDACSSAPAPTPVATVHPNRPVPIDGTYGGLMQLSRGEAINCGNDNPITVRVENHALIYSLPQPQADWKPFIVFRAPIGPNGSFNARSGPDSMTGTISGGIMQGEIVGDVCGFTFTADHDGIL